MVHQFHLVFHDVVAGGEELAELWGGILWNPWFCEDREARWAGLGTHFDGEFLLSGQLSGVFLVPFFEGLGAFFWSGILEPSHHFGMTFLELLTRGEKGF